jgi:hypothetical protein
LILLDLIKNWRLKHKIPENMSNEKRWRFGGDGITKVPLDDQTEVDNYRIARERLELWKKERNKPF